MLKIRKHFDVGSLIIIAVTFVLFVSAVFTKGLTHDILLEVAIFLVSVKLIVMAYKNIDATDSLHQKLDKIYSKVNAIELSQSQKDNDNN
ncbi:MAG: hypothetical protein ABFS35_23120 [Bacteroidota bacterium]